RNVEILPPSTYNRRISDELERIVMKALAKDVDDRYQNAIDLHDDLQAFMYTAGEFYSRKDLASWMKKVFAAEIEQESAKREQYRQMPVPQLERPAAATTAPPAPPNPPARRPTVMGMGALPASPPPPPPPPSRPSGPHASISVSPPAPAPAPPSKPELAALPTAVSKPRNGTASKSNPFDFVLPEPAMASAPSFEVPGATGPRARHRRPQPSRALVYGG